VVAVGQQAPLSDLGNAEVATCDMVDRLVSNACTLFGLPMVRRQIVKSQMLGVRSYAGTEGPDTLVLASGHVDGPNRLSEGSLAFAIGAEIAHLFFKHPRVTSQDLKQGFFQMGARILGHVGPELAGGGKVARAASALVSGTASDLSSVSAGGLASSELDVVEGHRCMQLTADRAGLLLCGDIVSATRAVFLTDVRYAEELPIVERDGLRQALCRTSAEGHLVLEWLAIRIAWLIRFYLSDEYTDLRVAAFGTP
jgi:hypothetical protein